MNKNILAGLGFLSLAALGIIIYANRNAITPTITVEDQPLRGDLVTVATATAVDDSWLVIQTETNNVPGPVIGATRIKKGENKNIAIAIDKSQATPKLFAMIHVDDGEKGKLDFPGADMPLMYKGEMVSKLFSLK